MERSRIDWLDGARAYAIAGVVLVHASQLLTERGGWLCEVAELGQYGVQMFFVISAITIFSTLRNAHQQGEPTWRWWMRRYFRVAPLYYFGILLYGAITYLKLPFIGGEAPPVSQWALGALANFLFVHAFVPSASNSIVPGGWSIGVEMLFYAAAPALLYAMRRSGQAIWVLVLLTVLMLGATFAIAPRVNNNDFFYFWPPTQFPVIFAGLALCVLTQRWLLEPTPTPPGWNVGAGLILVASGAAGAAFGTVGEINHGLAPLAFGIAFCALTVLARDVLWVAFSNRAAVSIGLVSYSIYIVHFAILKAVRILNEKYALLERVPSEVALLLLFGVTLALAYAIALLTQRFIERPSRRLGHAAIEALSAKTSVGA